MTARATAFALAAPALLSGLVLVVLGRVAGHAMPGGHAVPNGMSGMSEADMRRWSESWWASHPRVGTASLEAPAATFTVTNNRFDLDNNAATQIDTAKIKVGESVLWQWIAGIHTVTNGTGADDPSAGTRFDQPSDLGHQQFTFAFNAAGTFRFFCRPHELVDMKGVVVVSATTTDVSLPGQALGFTAEPWPNPSGRGVSFGFALRRPGRAKAEVFDARGRRVAVVLDRSLEAGPHVASWDGRAAAGHRAQAGLYYLRLSLPSYSGSRAIVIAR